MYNQIYNIINEFIKAVEQDKRDIQSQGNKRVCFSWEIHERMVLWIQTSWSLFRKGVVGISRFHKW